MSILNALRGIGGEFEVSRVLGAAGVSTYIVSAPAFVAWDILHGHAFEVVAFCAAYPGGLGVALGALAAAVGWKDTKVADAKATEATTRITSARADTADAANMAATQP